MPTYKSFFPYFSSRSFREGSLGEFLLYVGILVLGCDVSTA